MLQLVDKNSTAYTHQLPQVQGDGKYIIHLKPKNISHQLTSVTLILSMMALTSRLIIPWLTTALLKDWMSASLVP